MHIVCDVTERLQDSDGIKHHTSAVTNLLTDPRTVFAARWEESWATSGGCSCIKPHSSYGLLGWKRKALCFSLEMIQKTKENRRSSVGHVKKTYL